MWFRRKFTQSGQVYYFSLLYSNLWRIAAYRRHFLQRQHKMYLIFLRFKFFKGGQICDFQWTSKSQKCFSFRVKTRGSAPGPRWGFRPQTPCWGPHTCIWGGLQLSNAGTDCRLFSVLFWHLSQLFAVVCRPIFLFCFTVCSFCRCAIDQAS